MQQKLDTHAKNFGLRLRAHVERHGTVERAYDAMGVSRATLFNWFKRELSPPGKEKLDKLRHYLGDKADWILYGIDSHLNSGGLPTRIMGENAATFGAVASRLPEKPRGPSTRQDCEEYVRQLLARAELTGDPNAFPVILHRLKKQFPLNEWDQATDDDS